MDAGRAGEGGNEGGNEGRTDGSRRCRGASAVGAVRRVVVFPDSGCLQKWTAQLDNSQLTDYSVSTGMERYQDNTDLLDLLMKEAVLKETK